MSAPSLTLATAWRAVSQALSDADCDGAVLKALAGIAGCLAARLYCPGDDGAYVFFAEWCWGTSAEEPNSFFMPVGCRDEGLTVLHDVAPDLPFANPVVWGLLPLPHAGQLSGVVLLACPARRDRPGQAACEALALAARQVGCHLAEQRARDAATDAARFGDFHRRTAFALHDIKGISSQINMLARNAERHGDNPEFRADMLLTLRAAAERLGVLLSRLSDADSYKADTAAATGFDFGKLAKGVAAGFNARHPVNVIERQPCAVGGNREAIEQVLIHLVQNAVDASPEDAPVFVSISADGPWCRVEIVDSGHGMSAEFVRNHLFRPFDTAKPGGFGIGAYEARELVRAMGGQMQVESAEGVGTRFVIRLPLAAVAKDLVDGQGAERGAA